MNLETLNPNLAFISLEQAGRAMLLAFFANIPIALWGAPGIGKSTKVYWLAAKVGKKLYDFRLSDKEAQDIGGIPMPINVNGVPMYIEYLIARGLLPFGSHEMLDGVKRCTIEDDDYFDPHCVGCEECILFIDEIDRTFDPAVKNAIQQVLLDRRVNNHVLSKNCRIVIAGNGTSDIDTSPLSKAANGRTIHLYIENESMSALDSWQGWGAEEIEHPEFGAVSRASLMLRAYAKANHLTWTGGDNNEKGKEKSEGKLAEQAEPTNRTWIYADTIMRATQYVDFRTSDILLPMVAGCVGKKAATELIAYSRIFDNAPTIEQILADPEKVEVPSRLDILYALTYSLCAQATRDVAIAESVATYGLRWPEEAAALMFRELLRRQPRVATTKPFQEWVRKRRRTGDDDESDEAVGYVNHYPMLVELFPNAIPYVENDGWVNRLAIASETNPSAKPHILSQRRSNLTWECSCPGWLSRRTCKHTSKVLNALKSPATV